MERIPQRVVIGMDPHKRSVTLDFIARRETVLGAGWLTTVVAERRVSSSLRHVWSLGLYEGLR